MRVWDEYLTELDQEVFAASGYGSFLGFGERPAILIVDVNYAFTGDKDEPLLDSIKKWHNSCGPRGWAAIPYIQQLLEAGRSKNLPIFYSTGFDPRPDKIGRGLWRNSRRAEAEPPVGIVGTDIVAEIAPQERDVLIRKTSPSVFFGTALMSYLTQLKVDSLVVCGTTTSGCVRATVIDAFANNLRVAVAEECTFDRGEASHAINLFDMNAKYADVMSTEEITDYIGTLSPELYQGIIAPAAQPAVTV